MSYFNRYVYSKMFFPYLISFLLGELKTEIIKLCIYFGCCIYISKEACMLEDELIPRAFKSTFLLSYDLFKGVIFECHKCIFNFADQESKRTQEFHMSSTPYSNFCIRVLVYAYFFN